MRWTDPKRETRVVREMSLEGWTVVREMKHDKFCLTTWSRFQKSCLAFASPKMSWEALPGRRCPAHLHRRRARSPTAALVLYTAGTHTLLPSVPLGLKRPTRSARIPKISKVLPGNTLEILSIQSPSYSKMFKSLLATRNS